MTGHEEEHVWLRRARVISDVTKFLDVAHDIQSSSLVDQTRVQSGDQVAHQQDECCSLTPRFQMSQRYSTEDHAKRQHGVDESELLVRKQTVNHDGPEDCYQQDFVFFVGEAASMKKEWEVRTNDDWEPLSEVPVPRMGAVETSHTVEDVKLEEVELHHGPLFIEQTVNHSGNHNSQSPNRNVVMSDEPEFVFFLPEMIDQQRKPDDQSSWTNNDRQGNQTQIFCTVVCFGPREGKIKKSQAGDGGLHAVGQGPGAAVPREPRAQMAEERPFSNIMSFQRLDEEEEFYISTRGKECLNYPGKPYQEVDCVIV